MGGSSAGATIQGSYLVRGAPEGNQIMMSPGHEEGFGFLRLSAIDQHVNTRKRAEDLRPVLAKHGLSVVQFPGYSHEHKLVAVETTLMHKSGQYVSGTVAAPVTKPDAQRPWLDIPSNRWTLVRSALLPTRPVSTAGRRRPGVFRRSCRGQARRISPIRALTARRRRAWTPVRCS